jgi:hypothetical protein
MFTVEEIQSIVQEAMDSSHRILTTQLTNVVRTEDDLLEAKIIVGKGIGIAEFAQVLIQELKKREENQ